jgi:hypothetical protein
MNKAFDDLIYQSGLIADGCWDELDTYTQEAIERLIELTVRECMDCSTWVGKANKNVIEPVHTAHAINQRIKKHFGVEE